MHVGPENSGMLLKIYWHLNIVENKHKLASAPIKIVYNVIGPLHWILFCMHVGPGNSGKLLEIYGHSNIAENKCKNIYCSAKQPRLVNWIPYLRHFWGIQTGQTKNWIRYYILVGPKNSERLLELYWHLNIAENR